MEISKELLKILVCPITKGKLIYDREESLLVSANILLGFPIVDGIPILLKDEAKSITPERVKTLIEKESLREQELLETNVA